MTLDHFLMATRVLAILIMILALFYFHEANSYQKYYEDSNQEDDEQVDCYYQSTFKKLEYGTIFHNIVSCLVTFNFVMGMKLTFSSDGAEAFFPIFDFLLLIPIIIGQIIYAKLVTHIRNYRLSSFPTANEIKYFVYSYDEAERQANFEQSFLTIFNLNQRILPALYIIIFIISTVTQTNQFLAYLVVTTIHIYINITKFRMVRSYFK